MSMGYKTKTPGGLIMSRSFFFFFALILSATFCTAACPIGDIDGNCAVGLGDLAAVADAWLNETGGNVNLDGLGKVDLRDLAILAEHWGEITPQLLINEFMADNKGTMEDPAEANEYPDWIEIYNFGSTPVDMGGMYLTDRLDTPMLWQIPRGVSSQTTVAPGSYAIIFADEDILQGPMHAGFKLSAGGEQIGLFDTNGTLIDSIIFGSQATDESYGRYPNGGPGWQKFANGTATPGDSNGGELADSGIVINEIMYHPGHDEAAFEAEPIGLEYIELYNSGTGAVDLGGWRLVDGVQFTVPAGTTIAANGYAVIAGDAEAFAAAYPGVANVVGGWTGKLTNQGEKITLVNVLGTVIDTVHYYDEGDWAKRVYLPADTWGYRGFEWSSASDGDGYSLELINAARGNEYGQNWGASIAMGGTPGAVNSNVQTQSAPFVLDVKHSPLVPMSSQAVTVTARIVDKVTTGLAVTLRWRIDQSTYTKGVWPTYDPASYTTVTMADNGVAPDTTAGDGIYTGRIPAQADKAIVEFFIVAQGASANARTYPAAVDLDGADLQIANLLYQVDDSFDPQYGARLGEQPVYRLVTRKAEMDQLKYIGLHDPDRYSNTQANTTFISIDGTETQCRYGVHIRNRGEGTRDDPPNNYRVNFRHDERWKGVTAINLNTKYTWLQIAGSAVMRMADLGTFGSKPVQVRVNGDNLALTSMGTTQGSYACNEVYDEDFAARQFPSDPDGNIYKCVKWVSTFPNWMCQLEYLGKDPSLYAEDGYSKQTNQANADWSGLIDLTYALDIEPDATYTTAVERMVDVDQWMRWFAAEALIGNNETNLSTGRGDDYQMYQRGVDGRFILLPHDLDTVLGSGDDGFSPTTSIFEAADTTYLPVIARFLKHPAFVRRYYAQLLELMETAFAPETINTVLDELLGEFVPKAEIDNMKQFVVDRNASVLGQIPLTFSIVSDLTTSNGFKYTTSNTTSLHGTANAVETYSVLVNGQPATYTVVSGVWTIGGITLKPGINRIVVETFDGLNGTGNKLQEGTIDIRYDDGSESTLSGTISGSTTLTAAAGPWRITGDIAINSGGTLTIEAGTTLFFNSGTGITVNTGGRLVAEGLPYRRIRMTRVPGSTNWDGLTFTSTQTDNRLTYVDHDYGDVQGNSFKASYSKVYVDHFSWAGTASIVLEMYHPSVEIYNSVIPGVSGEAIHGTWVNGPTEYFIIKGCTIGASTGTGDIVDWESGDRDTGARFMFINNTFLGGGDDGIDADGTDTYIEGNTFRNFHVIGTDTTSNTIASGKPYSGDPHRGYHVILRNTFSDFDHAVLLKEDNTAIIAGNTFANSTDAPIQFCEDGRNVSGQGDGATVYSNIFWDYRYPFKYLVRDDLPMDIPWTGDPVVSVNNCIITDANYPGSENLTGSGNIDADPLFVDYTKDLSLLAVSPAIAAGINGTDMGATMPAGASISGEPYRITHRTEATLTVAGPAITHYKYRLMDNGAWAGDWSDEIAISMPIGLTGLGNGHQYQVYVLGKNIEGLWPGDLNNLLPANPGGNPSIMWEINTSFHRLIINEVLARNTAGLEHEGTYPNAVELYYDGPTSLDLGGYHISDNAANPAKYTFAAGTIMNPGDYLILYADTDTATSGIHLGFDLNGSEGEGVYLYNSSGILVDSIEFGVQLVNLSIGRVNDTWRLTQPTFGQPNIASPVGDPRTLKINEWLANGEILFTDDFIEIYNPHQAPVDMGGMYLTDNPISDKNRSPIKPFTFVPAKSYLVFRADEGSQADHVNFRLSSEGEMIGLFDADLNEIDKVIYTHSTIDVSQGRSPDGGRKIEYFILPTPGTANVADIVEVTTTSSITINDVWSYNQAGSEPADWTNPANTIPDTTWPTGAALLYVESSSLPAAKNTPLTLGKTTYYFRKHFTFTGNPDDVTAVTLSTIVDDGAAVYLNGQEMLEPRLRLGGTFGADDLLYSTYAVGSAVDNAVYEYFSIPVDAAHFPLVNGDNVMAAEVHQYNSGSSDIVFGLALEVETTTSTGENPYAGDIDSMNSLRITEIMYNPASDPNSEFIELKNIGDKAINLEGIHFTNGIDFVFPAMSLDPGQYTVVVADQSVFEGRYGTQINVAGSYAGRLDNAGETIVLKLAEPLDIAVMRFEYKDRWYPATDGEGFSLVITNPAGTLKSWQEAESWRPSFTAGGTPGRDDIAGVMVNEVLAHSEDTEPDWIELYNPTSTAVEVGGWYLSDDAGYLMKYRIAEGTIIDPGDYLVLYENAHFSNAADPGSLVQFALSENGDDVYLSSGDAGQLTGYTVEVVFGASERGVSFGRYVKSDTTAAFVLMSSPTPNAANESPRVGPIVISEIMYNPPAGGSYAAQEYEYIELHNITDSPVTLQVYDADMGVALGWKFTEGIDYTFPLGTIIPANGRLIVSKNTAAFTARYGSIGTAVLGPYENATSLSNGGELLALSKPGDTDLRGVRYYLQIDSVLYDDETPWPAVPDGGGEVLDRIDDALYGDDVVNWQPQTPSPGI